MKPLLETGSKMQATAPTANQKLIDWVASIAQVAKPDDVLWCDGSTAEYDAMAQKLVDSGSFIKLNEERQK